LVECLKKRPCSNFNDLFYQNLKNWLDNNISIKFKGDIIDSSFFTYPVIDFLYQYLQNASLENYNTFNLVFNLLFKFAPEKLDSLISSNLPCSNTLVGAVIVKRYNYFIAVEKSKDLKEAGINMGDLNQTQACLLLSSLCYLNEGRKIIAAHVTQLNFLDQILLAKCFTKFSSDQMVDYRRLNILPSITLETSDEILKCITVDQFKASALINRLNNRISIYNSQTVRELSSVELSEKNWSNKFSTAITQLNESEYKHLRLTLEYVQKLNVSCLEFAVI
jgi:hypothetical protein